MKIDEMRERYKGEWALIRFGSMADLTEDLHIIEGDVVAHARSWKEIKRAEAEASRPGNYTVEYLGETPGERPLGEDLDEDIVIIT